jgi:Protein of unknown function (DUF2914)
LAVKRRWKGRKTIMIGKRPFVLTLLSSAIVGVASVASIPLSPANAQEQNLSGSSHFEQNEHLARGNAYLQNGDIASARLFYRLAAEHGNSEAAMRVGLTFDPLYLSAEGVVGMKPDVGQAAEWYARAMEMGSSEARSRSLALAQWLESANPETVVTGSRNIARPPFEGRGGPPSPRGDSTPDVPTAAKASPRTALQRSNDMHSVFDRSVVRSQLTSGIRAREPIDHLYPPIKIAGGADRQIFWFSEVSDWEGHTLVHRWEHDDQVVTSVSFPIHGKRWRVYSKKLITSEMAGKWRVVLAELGGKELASLPFVVE